MSIAEAKTLKAGDRIHWEVPGAWVDGKQVAEGDSPADGTIVQVGLTALVKWDDGRIANMSFSAWIATDWWGWVTKLQNP